MFSYFNIAFFKKMFEIILNSISEWFARRQNEKGSPKINFFLSYSR